MLFRKAADQEIDVAQIDKSPTFTLNSHRLFGANRGRQYQGVGKTVLAVVDYGYQDTHAVKP